MNSYQTRKSAQHYADEYHIKTGHETRVDRNGRYYWAMLVLKGGLPPSRLECRPQGYGRDITASQVIDAINDLKVSKADLKRYLAFGRAIWGDSPPPAARAAQAVATVPGLCFADCLSWFGRHQNKKERALAQKMLSEHSPCSDFDLDDDPIVSMDDDEEGGYVLCWKWVPAK